MKYFILLTVLMSSSALAKVSVLTTTTNLESIVKIIGAEHVSVHSFAKGTQDPHYLEAKPSYTFKASKADLLVSIGLSLETGWLPLIIRGARNPKLRVGQSGRLVASDFAKILDVRSDAVSRAEGDVHPEGNPHFLLSPKNALLVAKAVSNKLSEIDPKNKKSYQDNYLTFNTELSSKLTKWKSLIPSNLKVITYHKTLTYFYHEFGVSNVDMLESRPGIPPTASHIMKVIKKMKTQKLDKIIVENYFDTTVARRIQKSVKNVKISVVPVAVRGNDKVDTIIDLYDVLAHELGK